MATRRQSLILKFLLPCLLNIVLLFSVIVLVAFALKFNAPRNNWLVLLQDSYLHHVIIFSFWQAFLSTLLSVILAVLLARALWRRRFLGKKILLRLCTMTLVLPVLVVVFGLLSIYGHEGWLAKICTLFGVEYCFSPYGLKGILLAHLFFNLPLATRLLLQALENIPSEQRQLSSQLGIEGWNFSRLVEWPRLRRQILPAMSLIFILCFTSFATVLSLGGGPETTNIELAIFQALSYDYDPGYAVLLSILQIVCCLSFLILSKRLNKVFLDTDISLNNWRADNHGFTSLIYDILIIIFALLLLLPPLLAVVVEGVCNIAGSLLKQTSLWQATWTSLRIAIFAGLLSVVLTMLLLWRSHEMYLRKHLLEISSVSILTIPSIVLATGFFLLLNNTIGLPQQVDGIVILINALMAIPYAMKVLENPMRDIARRYKCLCLLLDISGWHRFRLIEFKVLQQPLAQALALSCVLSIGDFGVVSLFGNTDFHTLPFYLYQQIGAYRNADGSVTALLLLLLCFLLFTLIEKLPKFHANLN